MTVTQTFHEDIRIHTICYIWRFNVSQIVHCLFPLEDHL